MSISSALDFLHEVPLSTLPLQQPSLPPPPATCIGGKRQEQPPAASALRDHQPPVGRAITTPGHAAQGRCTLPQDRSVYPLQQQSFKHPSRQQPCTSSTLAWTAITSTTQHASMQSKVPHSIPGTCPQTATAGTFWADTRKPNIGQGLGRCWGTLYDSLTLPWQNRSD